MGGVQIYKTALKCVVDEDLKQEWDKYLSQTQTDVTKLEAVCKAIGIDPKLETLGRLVIRQLGLALVAAMKMALEAGDLSAAQLVACECVVHAETKDHFNWELLGRCAEGLGSKGSALKSACNEIEDEKDEHLYHTKGWCRELWIDSLGLKAVLPPLEEQSHVKTTIGRTG